MSAAAMPSPNGNGYDPFAALTQRFEAMDAAQEVEHSKARAAIKNGKAAVARLKRTAERATVGDSPSRTRLCIKSFSESDLERCDDIEEAAASAVEKRHLPVTEVLDPSEVRARLEAAAQATNIPDATPDP